MRDHKLNRILDSMGGRRALVVGDVMIDEYVWGNVKRISPEAPVIVVEVSRDSYMPGGAANVVNNIRALGGVASIVGIVGDDDAGRSLASCLMESGVDVSGLVVDASRPTTRKTRIIAHSQQVVRVDRESRKKPGRDVVRRVVSSLAGRISSVDVVVFSDYNKGMAGHEITEAVIRLAREHDKPVVVNPKPANVRQFKSASVVSLNQSEVEASAGVSIENEQDLRRAAERLVATLQPGTLLVTRGPDGMSLFDREGGMETLSAHLVEVYDVAGAGDTVVSVMALGLASGASVGEAAVLANCAGGAAVRKVGVATVTRDEIAHMLNGA